MDYIWRIDSEEKRLRQIAGALEQGMEKGIQQGMERGSQQGMERGIQQGLERGIQQGLERGIQQGLERGIQQGLERGIQQGLEKGREQERTSIATNCLKQGMSVKDIAAVTSLSIEELQTLASKIFDC